MGIDISRIGQEPVWLIASAVGLFLIKSPIIYLLARLFGQTRSVSLESGLLLGQGGEFGFLVVGMALTLGLMPADIAQFMLIVTGLTMLATPFVAHIARWLASRMEAWEAVTGQSDADLTGDLSGHVIVAGYGRVGQMIGSILESQELPHVGLDTDARLVAGFRKEGSCVFYGDASRPDMLRKFGADRAAALVVTMDSPRAAEKSCFGRPAPLAGSVNLRPRPRFRSCRATNRQRRQPGDPRDHGGQSAIGRDRADGSRCARTGGAPSHRSSPGCGPSTGG